MDSIKIKKYIVLIVVIILIIILGVYIYRKYNNKNSSISTSATPVNTQATSVAVTTTPIASVTSTTSPSVSLTQSPVVSKFGLVYPVKEFKERITKKPFGIYITPQNSPVQPERFSGYHTGADSEYQDVEADVPVYAISDGKVVFSDIVSGYGGVFILEVDLDSAKHTVLYGHIRPSSLPKIDSNVTKGEQIGLLGTGYTSETDGERRHLHFAILSNNRIDVKGYVQSESELSGWLNPLDYYN